MISLAQQSRSDHAFHHFQQPNYVVVAAIGRPGSASWPADTHPSVYKLAARCAGSDAAAVVCTPLQPPAEAAQHNWYRRAAMLWSRTKMHLVFTTVAPIGAAPLQHLQLTLPAWPSAAACRLC
jgi:hypothetical protein